MAGLIIEQFLYSNIAESYESQMKIPQMANKLVIPKRMIFQIISVLDISTSVYEQLSEATKSVDDLSWFHGDVEEENEEHAICETKKKTKKRGILKVEIEDGINKLHAVEYVDELFDIEELNVGMKIMLTGKAVCRKGIILISQSNCQILGGAVESLEYNVVDRLAAILKIDLNAETKRKELAKVRVNEMRKKRAMKKDKSQSTISPFLVKMPKVVEAPPKKVNPKIVEESNNNDVVFTPIPPPKNPNEEVPTNPEDIVQNTSNEKPTEVEEEEYSRILKNIHVPVRSPPYQKEAAPEINPRPKPAEKIDSFKKKQLPQALLEDENGSKTSRKSPPEIFATAEKYQPGMMSKIKIEENDSIIPPEFLREEVGVIKSRGKDEIAQRKLFKALTEDIHGPRGVHSKKDAEMQKKNSDDHSITEFFEKVKHLKEHKRVEPPQKVLRMGIVTPVPQKSCFETQKEQQKEEKMVDDSSILDCSMEIEGRNMCERLGIGETRKRRADDEPEILKGWNPNIQTYKISTLLPEGRVEERTMEIVGPSRDDKMLQAEPRKSNRPYPPNATQPSRQGLERPFNPPQRKAPSSQAASKKALPKHGNNVQIYRTPLARRIPSSESSRKFSLELLHRLENLHVIPFRDALTTRKFWMMAKIVVIMPTTCQALHELQSDGILWEFQVHVSDTSVKNVICDVSSELLDKIFGFSVKECKQLFENNQMDALRAKKIEAERKLKGFKRLDLIAWVEVNPDFNVKPIIIDVKTISDALNIL
ncbi:unnamed protein product [Caenorhabditis bovis]|uniref:RecQ mediated genome instability protein 1 OB-fold domain-containing protein n=1 Tax=Caenorhabditis bovis TaxID=2654633 RepID=A0A8S1F9G4_9PELO|nr:unnamed protein product [Caenorhabditis bovis]